MALPLLLLLELALYASCFICGIVTAALVTIVQIRKMGCNGLVFCWTCRANFQRCLPHFGCTKVTVASITNANEKNDYLSRVTAGKCLLYGVLQYNETSKEINVTSSSNSSLCYFVSSISVCVAIFCFSLTLFWVYSSCVDGEVRSRERMWLNVTLGMCGIFLFFLLITGCILRIGRDNLCGSLQKFNRCEDAQTVKWAEPYNGSKFYSSLQSAETSVWVNFFFWLVIGGLAFFQRRKGSSEYRGGGEDAGASPSETEPFLNRPGRPK